MFVVQHIHVMLRLCRMSGQLQLLYMNARGSPSCSDKSLCLYYILYMCVVVISCTTGTWYFRVSVWVTMKTVSTVPWGGWGYPSTGPSIDSRLEMKVLSIQTSHQLVMVSNCWSHVTCQQAIFHSQTSKCGSWSDLGMNFIPDMYLIPWCSTMA